MTHHPSGRAVRPSPGSARGQAVGLSRRGARVERELARFSGCQWLRLSMPNHEADQMGDGRTDGPFRFVLNFRSADRRPADHARLAVTVPRPEVGVPIERPQVPGAQARPNHGGHVLIRAATRQGKCFVQMAATRGDSRTCLGDQPPALLYARLRLNERIECGIDNGVTALHGPAPSAASSRLAHSRRPRCWHMPGPDARLTAPWRSEPIHPLVTECYKRDHATQLASPSRVGIRSGCAQHACGCAARYREEPRLDRAEHRTSSGARGDPRPVPPEPRGPRTRAASSRALPRGSKGADPGTVRW